VVDLVECQPGFVQAIADGIQREAGIVLAPGEALLLRGCNDSAVHHQRRGAVVIEG
jgi:hypothetical protein